MSRFRAFGWHLTISAFIAIIVVTGMLALWYPPSFFQGMGGTHLTFLIVAIDIVIGPLITLIIFNPKKRLLWLDLCIIAFMQLIALGYGLSAVYNGRPVFVVFVENRFMAIPANHVELEKIDEALPRFRTLSKSGPLWAVTIPPKDPELAEKLLFETIGGGGLAVHPEHYAPYEENVDQVLQAAIPLDNLDLNQLNERPRSELRKAIVSAGKKEEEMRYLPLRTRFSVLTVLIDATTAKPLAFAHANPRSSDGL